MAQPRVQMQATESRGDVLMRRLIVEPEQGIRLPVVEIQPRQPGAGLVIVPGKSVVPAVAVASILGAGLAVALVDPRNTGEAEPGSRRSDNWSWFMGQPWTGMWASDIAATAVALAAAHPGLKIGVLGTGTFAKATLFAAALFPGITACAVRLEKAGYRKEAVSGALSDVPRILATTDLAGLAALCAPRACRIEFPPEESEQFRQAYAWPAKFSTMGFGTSPLALEPAPSPDWNARAVWLARMLR
jgi:hypothetical protein